MPEAPNHNHPSYEDTFKRIATILDVIAQEQQEEAQEQALRGAAFDARMRELAESQKATDARIRQLAEGTDARMGELGARLRELADEHKLTERALREYVEEGRIRDAETTDKLNGLIELMDRHLREHGQQ
jgi:hypothetical protein